MSDFDFDALRDPAAPEPDGRQRAAVDARARTLRRHTQRTRILTGVTSLVIIVAIAAGVVAATRDSGPTVTVANPSTTLPPTTTPTSYGRSVESPFVPATQIENGRGNTVLPVTLPDGETFTLTYPAAMKIAQLGFTGIASVGGKTVSLFYTTIQHEYAGDPITTLPGANGTSVSVFHANQRSGHVGLNDEELAYQFGKWLAVVEAPAGAAEQAQWASHLSGVEDADGYLVLHAHAPLTLGKGFEGGFVAAPNGGDKLELASYSYCGQPESDTSTRRRETNGDGSKFVAWCDGQLHLVAEGSPTFVDLAATQLQVSAFPERRAPTITTPPDQPNPLVDLVAESASFVSPDEGWVLERYSGCSHDPCRSWIARTTDGGASWDIVGNLRKLPYGSRIRFADAQHGFVFSPTAHPEPLLATDDGGATWDKVTTPFSTISDLAISHGIVYAVGVPAGVFHGSFPGFRIWSLPVGTATWHMDPLVISPGAGPVPEQQLVFSGDRGWMINSDRGVVSGARLSATTGRWSEWTPPCKDVTGAAASLTASTSTDLAAVCSPGFASDSRTTYVEFSHDAGDSFERSVAPGGRYGAGGPLSPTPNAAVIGVDISLLQTTDDGHHWRTALKSNDLMQQGDATGYVAMRDFGFTTTTEGFIVMDNGYMFMTHDGGTSWTRVTLP